MSGGCDDAGHGWPLEGHDSVASAGWTETYERAEAFHSRNHGAHADPASSGTCCRWHRQERRQENDPPLRLLFAFPVWKDARPGGSNDVQLGTFSLEASVTKTMICFSLLPFAIESGTVGDARAPICFNPEASQKVMPYYELRSKFGIEVKRRTRSPRAFRRPTPKASCRSGTKSLSDICGRLIRIWARVSVIGIHISWFSLRTTRIRCWVTTSSVAHYHSCPTTPERRLLWL